MAPLKHSKTPGYFIGPDDERYPTKFQTEFCTQQQDGLFFVLKFTDKTGKRWRYRGDVYPFDPTDWQEMKSVVPK